MKKLIRIINKNYIIVIILILLAFVYSLQNSVSIIKANTYTSIDVSVWINIAKLIKNGKIVYKDVFDHKGPLLYFLYFIGYSVGGTVGIWFLDFLCGLIYTFMIYKICRELKLNKKYSIFVVCICIVFLSFLCLENPCTESIALVFILIALYEFIKFMNNEKIFNKKESIITRCMLGSNFIIKT